MDNNSIQSQYNVVPIPAHIHNGIDSNRLPPTSVINFVPLPTNNGATQETSGVLSANNVGYSDGSASLNAKVATFPYNVIYPVPVIQGYGVGGFSQFNGGIAPVGTLILFNNSTIVNELWARMPDDLDPTGGTWVNVSGEGSGGGTSFGGNVASGGTATSLPSGWTSAKTGTGAYTVTHNLGSTDYGVSITSSGGQFGVFAVYAINSNSFDCSTVSLAASLADCAFSFVLTQF